MFKVLIAGGRTFNNYEMLKKIMDHLLSKKINTEDKIVVISGGARGADTLGERYAREKGYSIQQFLPDWNTYGKKAGMLRNTQLVEAADVIVCFFDGQSHGTKNTIETAKKSGKPLRIFDYEGRYLNV